MMHNNKNLFKINSKNGKTLLKHDGKSDEKLIKT